MYHESASNTATVQAPPRQESCAHDPSDRRIYTASHPHTEWCESCGKVLQ